MIKRLLLLMLFLCPLAAFGQGVMTSPQTAFQTVNGVTRPIPAATITVCAANAGGIPCAPALINSIFRDAALTQPLSNPFAADASGNYQFGAAPGNYTVTVTAVGYAGYSYQVSLSSGTGGGTLPPLTSAHIFVGNISNVPTDTPLGGDCGLSNAGVITCARFAPNQNIIYVSPNCGTQTNCYPAKFDVQYVTDASSTLSSTTITTPSTDPPFVAGDVGKSIFGTGHFTNVAGGGTGNIGTVDLPLGTITTFVSAHQVTVSIAATATDAGTMYLAWGHDDTANLAAAITAAVNAAVGGHGVMVNLPQGIAFTTKGINPSGAISIVGQGETATTLIPLPSFDFTTGAGNSCGGLFGATAQVCFTVAGLSQNYRIYGLGQPISGTPNVVLWVGGGLGDQNFGISGWGADNNTVTGLAIEPGLAGVQLNVLSQFAGGVACSTPPETGNFEADSLLCINDQGTALKTTTGVVLTAHNNTDISYTGTAVNATSGSFIDDGGNTFVGTLTGNITQFGAFGGGLGASFQDGKEIAAPANPAAGNDRLFFNGTTHLLDCHTTSGGSCMPAGGGLTNPMTTIGDMIGGGAAGVPARIVGGLTGQTVVAANGATPAFVSPGLPWGNAGAVVTTTPYAPLCDSGTAIRDRDKVIVFQSGASVINMPDPTAAGCTGNFVVSLYDDGGGTLTVNRGGTATFNVLDGSTNTDAATSFTLANGQTALLNANAAGTIWTVKKSTGGSGGISGLTAGVIPQAGVGGTSVVNSSPLLDNGNTTANTLTYAGGNGILAPQFISPGPFCAGCNAALTSGAGELTATGALQISGYIGWFSGGSIFTSSRDTTITRDSPAIIDFGDGTPGDSNAFLRTGLTVQLTSNFTTTSTSLVTITGLSWTFPSTNHNYGFDCRGSYSQATAAAADAFGVQAATTAPTNLEASMIVQTSAINGGTNATLPTLTTTTATNIGTFTPSAFGPIGAIAEIYTFTLHGQLQQGAGATTLNIMTSTGNASDALTIYAGTTCTLEP